VHRVIEETAGYSRKGLGPTDVLGHPFAGCQRGGARGAMNTAAGDYEDVLTDPVLTDHNGSVFTAGPDAMMSGALQNPKKT
jgi:hypothetical protein